MLLEELIMMLITDYGPTGLGFGVLLLMLFKQKKDHQKEMEQSNKRITELENRQAKMQEDHKNDYADLTKESINVISGITSCIERLKDAINYLERKS